ncbi:MAG TPA: hypothetical protein VFZ27_04695 [Terriglobia bacterium]|nr:hypothetical protein [Terriglobia bacterium]
MYQAPGVVVGDLMMVDVPRSLVFTNGFAGMGMMGGDMPELQTLEGVWWKHDAGVGGFLSLTNTTSAPVTVGVRVLGAHGLPLPNQSVNLGPHAAQMFDLASLTAGLPGLENQEGGVRIQYQGMMGDVIPVGGLENDSEGYSADMPIWPHNPPDTHGKKHDSVSQNNEAAGMTMPSPVPWTLGAVGIMKGYPDPAMGFPGGTHFTPYITLRNTSSTPLLLKPALYLATTGESKTFSMPNEVLAPYETRQVDMAKRLKDLNLTDFNGNINVTYSFVGQQGDLIMAPGSVDQTGNYVFQVLAQTVNPGWARDVGAWTVAGGYDTMLTLWNPSNTTEDLMAIFYFPDGSGQYQLPVHLAARASMGIDMAQLIALSEPDAKGHTFPAGISGGSVEFTSPQGMSTTINLSVGAAEFNIENATCSSCCICCGGISQILVCPNPGYCPYNVPEQMYAEVYFTNGGSADITGEANWSTGNGTIATVGNTRGGNKGIVTGHAVGSTTLSAQFTSTMAAQFCICNGYCYTRSSGTGSGSISVEATPTNFHQVDESAEAGGVLHFDYAWGSSSGNLADLTNCTVNEKVSYPGTQNPYVWPDPPWNTATPNPTIAPNPPVPGTDGAASDNHSPGTFVKPYQAANFNASQIYQYSCTGGISGTLMGPLTISRSVSQNSNGTWKYMITKSGASASINPLP